jgi:two-component system response regulator
LLSLLNSSKKNDCSFLTIGALVRKLNRENLRIVIVENDEDDVFFLKRALQQGGFVYPFVHLKNGAEAIDYFQKLERPASCLPDIVLMDIKMPAKDGFEVLEWLRGHRFFKDLPVIMLTSSSDLSDMRKSQRLGVFKFLTKRVHYDNVLSALEGFVAVCTSSDPDANWAKGDSV